MPEAVTVIGDVHVEQFRPVLFARESVHGENISVYRSESELESRRTVSPGGAAYLAHLLHTAGVAVQAVLPVRAEWSLWLPHFYEESPLKTLRIVELPSPTMPNRVESLYMRDASKRQDRPPERWRLQLRIEELHPTRATSTDEAEATAMLIIDDYRRGAVNAELLASMVSVGAERIIVSPQYRKDEGNIYTTLLRSAKEVIVVCNEREALAWAGIEDLPTKFPPGHPSDHETLIKRVLMNMMSAFESAAHIIVNLAGPPARSLHLTRSVKEGQPHYVALVAPARVADSTDVSGASESVPGADTFFLAALAGSLLTGAEYDVAVARAVGAAAYYTDHRVDDHHSHFGRVEALPSPTIPPRVVTSYLLSIGPNERPVEPENDFLRQAQFHGKLYLEPSVLADYYAPKEVNQQIGALIRALSAYSDKTSKRPFNVLLEADPGSGKSYLAYCLARQLERNTVDHGGPSGQYPLEEKNLSLAAGLPHVERALADLYEAIRDYRVVGRTPVVLVDEFDTLASGAPNQDAPDEMDRLFAQMLAPLWDGVFAVDGRPHRLGGFILLLAVSTPEFMRRLENAKGKAKDFLSRIDVRLNLRVTPSADDMKKANVSVAVAMLRKHFGGGVKRVQVAVLDAIAHANLGGKNRVIDQLIMMSSRPTSGVFALENLPDVELRNRLVPGIDVDAARKRYGTSIVEI